MNQIGPVATAEKATYLEVLLLIERLHRRLLDVLKAELDRLGRSDVNNVQTLILYNIGEDELTVGELSNRGYYLGSNVSYNVKKLVEFGYLHQERSTHDRWAVRIRLSEKGLDLRRQISGLFDWHVQALFTVSGMAADELQKVNGALRALEGFWSAQVRFGG
ncbi:MAG: MarR family transcriptional regulator [Alphaproteobacteria bacterium]|nr:MarR family transcriptional regulator [Alphaproteobacteria bacterium]